MLYRTFDIPDYRAIVCWYLQWRCGKKGVRENFNLLENYLLWKFFSNI